MLKGANHSTANCDRPWQPLQKKVYYQQCTQSPYPGDTRSMALVKMSLRCTFTLLFWLNTAKHVFVAFYVHQTPDITKMGFTFFVLFLKERLQNHMHHRLTFCFYFPFAVTYTVTWGHWNSFFLSRHDLSSVITAWENSHPMGVCRRLGKSSAFLSGASRGLS